MAAGNVAQCILIKVTTRSEMVGRVIDNVQFAERVPTTASGGQGKKREGAAYNRKEGWTTGGSGGSEEKKARKDLSELSKRTDLDDDHEGFG